MTKTLTEQWREGKLPVGNYYINLVGDIERVDFFEGLKWERTKDFGIEEVLVPVPSYDEVKEMDDELKELATKNDTLAMENGRLKERLEIATKALKEYANCKPTEWMSCVTADKALKEMEGVK